jgi:hypothetical protein
LIACAARRCRSVFPFSESSRCSCSPNNRFVTTKTCRFQYRTGPCRVSAQSYSGCHSGTPTRSQKQLSEHACCTARH